MRALQGAVEKDFCAMCNYLKRNTTSPPRILGYTANRHQNKDKTLKAPLATTFDTSKFMLKNTDCSKENSCQTLVTREI